MDPAKNRRLLNGCALGCRECIHVPVSSFSDALKLMFRSATSKRGWSRPGAAPLALGHPSGKTPCCRTTHRTIRARLTTACGSALLRLSLPDWLGLNYSAIRSIAWAMALCCGVSFDGVRSREHRYPGKQACTAWRQRLHAEGHDRAGHAAAVARHQAVVLAPARQRRQRLRRGVKVFVSNTTLRRDLLILLPLEQSSDFQSLAAKSHERLILHSERRGERVERLGLVLDPVRTLVHTEAAPCAV